MALEISTQQEQNAAHTSGSTTELEGEQEEEGPCRNKEKELKEVAAQVVENQQAHIGVSKPFHTASIPATPQLPHVELSPTPQSSVDCSIAPILSNKSIPVSITEALLDTKSELNKLEPSLEISSEPSTPSTLKKAIQQSPLIVDQTPLTPPASPTLSGAVVEHALKAPELTLSPDLPKLVFGSTDESKITHKKLITVCMHGDEFCGMAAMNELIKEGFFNITKAASYATTKLTVVLGNPKAVLANKRFIDVNLNRIFHEQRIRRSSVSMANAPDTPMERDVLAKSYYEVSRVQVIADEIADCDEYIDIHSTSARSSPFALPALDPESEEFARGFNIDFVIEKLVKSVRGTSIGWAHALNKKAVCFECGQHEDRSTTETAKQLIKRFVTDRIDGTAKSVLTCPSNEVIRKGFRYARKVGPPKAFEKVNYRELLAYDEEVGEIRCNNPKGAFIIMPTANPILGEEAWFWGELTDSSMKIDQLKVSVPSKQMIQQPFQSMMSTHARPSIEVHS